MIEMREWAIASFNNRLNELKETQLDRGISCVIPSCPVQVKWIASKVAIPLDLQAVGP